MKKSGPKKILCVFGTRPEAIKMAPVVLALKAQPRAFKTRVVVTAQHRGMLDQVLRLFKIRPDVDLNLMRPGQSLSDLTVRALDGMKKVLARERPDMVLVHGDTTTTFAAALASYYAGVPVGHVEAGLRSGDVQNPFPEELNRRLADDVSSLHFAPTEEARRNLLREGIPARGISVTGNTGIDALKLGLKNAARKKSPVSGSFVLLTCHRRENFGEPLKDIFGAVSDVAHARPDVSFVYPVHPNPQVQGVARTLLGGLKNVRLLSPLDYGDLLPLLRDCRFVLTDSGGLQEEAPSLGKPVLVLRRVTERPEGVAAGTARLVGTDRQVIREAVLRLLTDSRDYVRMARAVNPYGDGRASQRIISSLIHFFAL